MKRVASRDWLAAIQEAHRIIPAGLLARLQPDYLLGVDPVFVGLHRFESTDAGHAYGQVAHVAYPHHQLHWPRDRRATTVVLPTAAGYSGWYQVHAVIHELGHVLHEQVGFTADTKPVSDYAQTNHYEAFAEAFASWCWSPAKRSVVDERTSALFDSLA